MLNLIMIQILKLNQIDLNLIQKDKNELLKLKINWKYYLLKTIAMFSFFILLVWSITSTDFKTLIFIIIAALLLSYFINKRFLIFYINTENKIRNKNNMFLNLSKFYKTIE